MSALEILREYGQAIRGDWGSIDGRSVQDDLELLANEIEYGPTRDDETLRDACGLCHCGDGHWFLQEDCGGIDD